MATIAVMTDFGLKDGNVGVMKGVIWGICPDARIADVTHLIGPQNLAGGGLRPGTLGPVLPRRNNSPRSVVDPGVGTERRPMAAALGGGYYVGPDNGIITLWLERALPGAYPCEFVALDRPEYWLPGVSHVFHGRDIFAPTAAHLAAGVPLLELGTPFSSTPCNCVCRSPQGAKTDGVGKVIHIDHFGISPRIFAVSSSAEAS